MANLRRGSRGQEVKKLQEALNSNLSPNPNLVTDGIFGRNTDAAVRAYQRQVHITIDGIAGSQTKSALGLPVTDHFQL